MDHNRQVLPPFILLTLALLGVLLHSAPTFAQSPAGGKIKGTGGVSSIGGSGGGGLISWATLSSYAAPGERGGVAFASRADLDDFRLDVMGFAFNWHDRMEASYARQDFRIKAGNVPIVQDRFGFRYRVAGDLIYDSLPQITFGIEHGRLRDTDIALAVGARHTRDTDYVVSIARAWLNGIGHRTTLLNVNLRHSRANQYGLLGYGGDDTDRVLHGEFAAAIFFNRQLAAGVEYRQKPDNLSSLREQSARDVFLAWFPNKHFSVTAAWLDLGDIAGAANQTGYYLSLQTAF